METKKAFQEVQNTSSSSSSPHANQARKQAQPEESIDQLSDQEQHMEFQFDELYKSMGIQNEEELNQMAMKEAQSKLDEMEDTMNKCPSGDQLDPLFALQKEAMRRFDEAEKENKLLKLRLKQMDLQAMDDELG
jgi:hypothetical protein